MKINHNPSKGIYNISSAYLAIRAKHVQVNAIRVKMSIQSQPRSGIAEIEELSQLDNEP